MILPFSPFPFSYASRYSQYSQYSNNCMIVNWYRTREINFQEELSILGTTITVPLLFIQPRKDQVFPPPLGKGMDKLIPNITHVVIDGAHWALINNSVQVNRVISDWLRRVVFSEGEGEITGTGLVGGKL